MSLEWPDAHVEMGEFRLSFCPNAPMGAEFEAKALEELRETSDIRESSLKALKNMIKENGQLSLRLDDEKIYLSFLRSCKFYPDSAYKKMVSYYKFTGNHPKIFGDLIPSREDKALKNNIFAILPNRDKEGRRILLIQGGTNWNVREVSLTELMRSVMLLIMGAIVEKQTQVAGAIVIIDLKGLTINHVWQFSPATAKFLLDYLQDCVPCRVKAIHIVNHPFIFNMLFNIFKPFMQEKLRNRIFFHGEDRSKLKSVVGSKSLPRLYGGEMNFDPIYGRKTWEMLTRFDDFYKLALENKYIPPTKNK